MNGFAILKPIAAKESTTPSGFVLSASSQKNTVLLEVHALAPTNVLVSGEALPVGMKVGDTVLCGKFSGEDVVVENVTYRIIDISAIKAVIE